MAQPTTHPTHSLTNLTDSPFHSLRYLVSIVTFTGKFQLCNIMKTILIEFCSQN